MSCKVKRSPDRIINFFLNDWVRLLFIFVTGTVYDVGIALIPYYQGTVIDLAMEETPFDNMLYLCLGFVLLMVVLMVCRFIKKNETRQFSNNATYQMRKKIFESFLGMPVDKLQSGDIGDSLSRSLGDVANVSEGMRKVVTEIFDTGFQMLAYIGYLMYVNWKIGLASLIPLPFALALFLLLKQRIFILSKKQREAAGRISSLTYDLSDNASMYKMFGRNEDNTKRYEEALEEYKQISVRVGFLTSAVSPFYKIIALVGLIPIILMGSPLVIDGTLKVGLFSSMLTTYVLIAHGLTIISKVVASVEKGRASWKRIKPLLSEKDKEGEALAFSPSTLEFSSFGLTFDGKVLFKGLCLKAKAGDIIGITGKVASGKSALGLSIIKEKQYDGGILINDQNIGSIPDESIGQYVVYMGHNAELFSDTVRENISLGDNVDVASYLKVVCIDDEVESMPNGDLTLIGNKGMRLSGGQQQRLALARTLSHIRPIVVLDDPFSSVDKATEEKIFNNIAPIIKDSVVILISHRISNFPKLSKIIYLDGEGHAIEGTHQEVYEISPDYRNLYDLQEGGDAQ